MEARALAAGRERWHHQQQEFQSESSSRTVSNCSELVYPDELRLLSYSSASRQEREGRGGWTNEGTKSTPILVLVRQAPDAKIQSCGQFLPGMRSHGNPVRWEQLMTLVARSRISFTIQFKTRVEILMSTRFNDSRKMRKEELAKTLRRRRVGCARSS